MNGEQIKEANQLIDLIEYAVDDLSYFSVYNDDVFNFETSQMEELVKMARRNMPKEKVHTEEFTNNQGVVFEITIQ